MGKLNLAGIDVSCDELVVAVEGAAGRRRQCRFDNDAAGHKKLVGMLTKGGRCARVCLEATGIYSLDVSLALYRDRRIEVMVANPRAISDFAKAYLQRSKTDATDADAILEFARRMPFVTWTPPAREILDLRGISRRIAALTKMAAQEKNRLHAADHWVEGSAVVRRDVELHINHLKRRIDELRGQALELIKTRADLQERFEQLVSVKGIAEASAVQILAEISVLPEDMTVRQWVAHAGLDPRHFESGTSVRKRPRISKAGNKYLRAALYMPALVAVQHEPNVRAFYDKLLARDKTKMQANIAVMRKLLHAIYGMAKYGSTFDGEKFYAIAA